MTKCLATCANGKRCKKQGTPFCLAHTPMDVCAICLNSSYIHSPNNTRLFCGHVFCQECIHNWIILKGIGANCPICRTPINNTYVQEVLYHERRRNE